VQPVKRKHHALRPRQHRPGGSKSRIQLDGPLIHAGGNFDILPLPVPIEILVPPQIKIITLEVAGQLGPGPALNVAHHRLEFARNVPGNLRQHEGD
jgi:hypothetical protein